MKRYIKTSEFDDAYYDEQYYKDRDEFEEEIFDIIKQKTGYEAFKDYGIASSGMGISSYLCISSVYDDSGISDDRECYIWFPEALKTMTPEEAANQLMPYVEMSVEEANKYR